MGVVWNALELAEEAKVAAMKSVSFQGPIR
jgi:hypothetical protein